MSKEKADILSKIGKDAGFKVPDGYFDDFAERVAKDLPKPTLTPIEPVTRWQRIRPFVYMADNPEILAGFENEAGIDYLLMSGDISEYDILMYGKQDSIPPIDENASEAVLEQSETTK